MRERTRPNLTVSAKFVAQPKLFDASHVHCVSPNAKPMAAMMAGQRSYKFC